MDREGLDLAPQARVDADPTALATVLSSSEPDFEPYALDPWRKPGDHGSDEALTVDGTLFGLSAADDFAVLLVAVIVLTQVPCDAFLPHQHRSRNPSTIQLGEHLPILAFSRPLRI